ncbi:TPA: signal transduction protein PmrD [Salmonella enterica]|nr:signal transduction protein PmrD [Salmonella enterica]MCH5736167.1 signal transduction protein PmrD [Salmonella enterica]MCH5745096.1 signal transduction protein PmrD [Salmonella enterica]MCH5745890.1 signal transduction protein PmrD [Salmonella enterica]MCH5755062.1 signal transduction protein PmrD [Salmonella enterica]
MMEWLVLKVISRDDENRYCLVVWAGKIKMQAEVHSLVPVQSGDTLYPLRHALYSLNRREKSAVRVIKAEPYTSVPGR